MINRFDATLYCIADELARLSFRWDNASWNHKVADHFTRSAFYFVLAQYAFKWSGELELWLDERADVLRLKRQWMAGWLNERRNEYNGH